MRILFTLLSCLFAFSISAQNIGINNNSPDSSAILDITSDDKGLLIPRLTGDARRTISAPAEGLLVFDSDTAAFMFFSAGSWHLIMGGTANDSDWTVEGDHIYNQNGGNVGIGTNNPQSDLHIQDTTGNAEIRIGGDSLQYIVGIDEAEGTLSILTDSAGFEDTNILTLTRQGEVGIGTNSPEATLHLADKKGAKIRFSDSLASRSYNLGFEETSGEFGLYVDSSVTGVVKPILTISDAGDVYLGAPSDSGKVIVPDQLIAGSIRLSGSFDSGDALIVDSDGNMSNASLKNSIVELYNNDADALSNSFADINWGVQRFIDTCYSHAPGGAEVTVNRTATYEISYTVTVDGGGLFTATSVHLLQVDRGAGYLDVPGSKIYTATNGDPMSATRTITLSMADGDKIKMQGERNAMSLDKVDGGYGLRIKRIHRY